MTDKDKDDTSRPPGDMPDNDRDSPSGGHGESQEGGYDPGEWGGGGGGGLGTQGKPENLFKAHTGGFVEHQGSFWSRFTFWSRRDAWLDDFAEEEIEEETDETATERDHDEDKDGEATEDVGHGYDPGPPPEGD